MSESVRGPRGENLSLLLGGLAALLGAGVALLVLQSRLALFGRRSVGELAALMSLLTAAAAFVVAAVRAYPRMGPWLRDLPRWRKVVDVAGLTLVHAAFSLMAVTALFWVFSDAFTGVLLDRWAGAFLVGLACGVCAYATAASAASMTTESLSVLVALFLVVGATASALYASDEYWWQQHFSALGTAVDPSGVMFNFTLILTGLVLTTVASFLTNDLERWVATTGERRWKVVFVRLVLVVLGLLLAGVGLVPVNVSLFWHNQLTDALIAVFAIALVAVPFLFRRLSSGFFAVTAVIIALSSGALYLHRGIRYLNVTAFEMAAVGIVFGWLLLFIRTVSAALAGAAETAQLEDSGALALDGGDEPARDG